MSDRGASSILFQRALLLSFKQAMHNVFQQQWPAQPSIDSTFRPDCDALLSGFSNEVKCPCLLAHARVMSNLGVGKRKRKRRKKRKSRVSLIHSVVRYY